MMLNLMNENLHADQANLDDNLFSCGGQPALDMTDEIIIVLAKLIVIATAVTFYDELAGLLILLCVAVALVYEQRSSSCE